MSSWQWSIFWVSLFALGACGNENPFGNEDARWRVDGEFVDYKVMGLPGAYETADPKHSLILTDDGNLSGRWSVAAANCEVEIQGELVTLRSLKPAQASQDRDFSFGGFKTALQEDDTHVLVMEVSSLSLFYEGAPVNSSAAGDAESDETAPTPEQVCQEALEEQFNRPINLFFQPLKIQTDALILSGQLFERTDLGLDPH